MKLFTIGYEGVTQNDLIGALEEAGVKRLIDACALALSRRPSFSKTSLRLALDQHGIDYVHLKALGTLREAARRGRREEVAVIYREQPADPAAMMQAEAMRSLAEESPSVLLCFERDLGACHRQVLIDEMMPDADVVHLFA